jgi:hypothetical protein
VRNSEAQIASWAVDRKVDRQWKGGLTVVSSCGDVVSLLVGARGQIRSRRMQIYVAIRSIMYFEECEMKINVVVVHGLEWL